MVCAQQLNRPGDASVQLAQYPGAPLEDRDGNLWFSTVRQGLIKYDGNEFHSFTTDDGLPSNMIRGMFEQDDGTLLVATNDGLVRYDGNAFTSMTDYQPLKVTRGFSEHGNHRSLWNVLVDSKGTLWITTMDGVFRHDGDHFTRFTLPVVAPRDKAEFAPKMVYCVYEDRQGNLWFGTDGAGAVRYDGDSMVVFTEKDHGLCSDNVCAILQDSKGNMWFGTSGGGVSKFDGDSFTTHLRTKEFSVHTGWGRYMSIIEDQAGDVWFGASHAGGGVYRYDGNDFEYLSQEHGLGIGGVPSIRLDRRGNVWLGTTEGVYHYDGNKFINFTLDNPQLPKRVASIDGWIPETFELPSGFAPDLPRGKETLLFSPGWRDPSTEGFWSYAFVMWIDESEPDADRLTELLDTYYTGLMSAFGVGRDDETPANNVRVELKPTGDASYEAAMNLIDGFKTFEPIEIRVLIETWEATEDQSAVSIRVSPQPKEHEIWQSLEAAIKDIRSQAE